MPRGKPRPKTIPLPNPEAWRDRFKASSIRVGFQIGLTRTMLEYLCSVAEGVQWDRHQFGGIHNPDSWYVSQAALFKRGLIEAKPPEEYALECQTTRDPEFWGEWNKWQLTAAGKHVVELLKLAGLFVQADAAITKKARG